MSAQRLRLLLLGLVAVALVLSIAAQKADSQVIGWLSFVVFAAAVAVYFSWRRALRARVFDREAKTPDETRTRPDQ
jgi:hypothetical protein